jgi:hypothetical protein
MLDMTEEAATALNLAQEAIPELETTNFSVEQ